MSLDSTKFCAEFDNNTVLACSDLMLASVVSILDFIETIDDEISLNPSIATFPSDANSFVTLVIAEIDLMKSLIGFEILS